jgi:endonuclease III
MDLLVYIVNAYCLRHLPYLACFCVATIVVVDNVIATSESKIDELIKMVGFHRRKAE